MTNQTPRQKEEPVVESKKPEVKTLVDLMPTKEQLYVRPFDAAPPPSDPE